MVLVLVQVLVLKEVILGTISERETLYCSVIRRTFKGSPRGKKSAARVNSSQGHC